MNLSHRKSYLYFVVPKCASRTIRTALRKHTDIGYPVDDFPQHMTMTQFRATEYATLIEPYFTFTFVRNPYDRLYSGYLQDRFAAENYPEWTEIKQPIFDQIGDDFNRYVKDFACREDTERRWDYVCFWPMVNFAQHGGVWCLDWFGRVENLQDDWAKLTQLLGIDDTLGDNLNVRVPDKGKRKTGQLKYFSKYERGTVELVNEYYREDFERFDYQPLRPRDFPRTLGG